MAIARLCYWVSSLIKPKIGLLLAAEFFGLDTLRIKLCCNKLRLTQEIIFIHELVVIVEILGFFLKFW
jgi:hypothetical protein